MAIWPFGHWARHIKNKRKRKRKESEFSIDTEIRTKNPIFLEKGRMAQILENLISNAIKYRNTKKDESYVKVIIERKETNLMISIKDNGIGIPEKNHHELFKMFKRFHPNVNIGSGLGLAIIKKNIDKLEGEIRVKSSEAGTEFEIRIPNAFG